jgi:hypothetical protein
MKVMLDGNILYKLQKVTSATSIILWIEEHLTSDSNHLTNLRNVQDINCSLPDGLHVTEGICVGAR